MAMVFFCASSKFLAELCLLNRARSIPPCIAWYARVFSKQAGAHLTTTAGPSSTSSLLRAASVCARKLTAGIASSPQSPLLSAPSRRKYETLGLPSFNCFRFFSSLSNRGRDGRGAPLSHPKSRRRSGTVGGVPHRSQEPRPTRIRRLSEIQGGMPRGAWRLLDRDGMDGRSICVAHAAQIPGLHSGCDSDASARHWREYRNLQRGERGAPPAASLSKCKASGHDLVDMGELDARASFRSGAD